MKFLIPTEADDTHAILAKIALEDMGHDVRFIFTADQPTILKNSVLIDNDTYQWRSTDKYDSIVENDYDVVWWRRARSPYLPKSMTHPSDYKFTVRENTLFYESLTYNMAPKAWWVNTKDSATRANSKLHQLKIAAESGMNIPTTLCSNDPQDIRYFLLKHEAEGVVYKPFCSNYWLEEQHIKMTHTTKLSFLELPSNQLLQLTPGIFQKEIKKKYGLRVTCFGNYIVAAKLNPHIQTAGKIDWHTIPKEEMNIEPYILPNTLETQIRTFMKKMGLVFGSLDFIVNEDHDYIFLKVDEQGEFLWIEHSNSDFKMLDIFIHFLLSKAKPFKWDPKKTRHTIDKYNPALLNMLDQNKRRHINVNRIKTQT